MDVSVLNGAILTAIRGAEQGSDSVEFDTLVYQGRLEKRTFRMYHEQDCCEQVSLNDIVGDINDLLFTPLLLVEERTDENETQVNEYDESFTWTFYEFRTIKGSVTLRWYGASNGYYSESVYFGEQT